MNDVADLMLRFKTDGEEGAIRALNAVDHGIDNVDRSAKSARGGLSGMFQTATGFVLGGAINMVAGSIFEIGKGILFANANAEQSKMSLETVMGSADAANAKFKELQAFAAQTPFAFPELVQSTINLESFGLKSSDWINTIGDTASAMGKSVDQVTQAVLDAQGGQYERLKELGIMASVEGDKVKFKYMKDGQEMVEAVDKNNQALINSTLSGIWNDKYEGAMEKQSNSFIGRWSTLKDNINMKLQEVSGGIFGFASGAIGILNSVFANGFLDTFDEILGPTITDFLGNLGMMGDMIINAFGSGRGVKEMIESLPASWRGAAGAILTMSDSIGDLYRAFQNGGLSELMSVFTKEAATFGGAVVDLGASINWAGLGRSIQEGARTALDGITEFGPIIGQAIADKFRSIEWSTVLTADSFEFGTTIGVAIRGAIERVGPSIINALSGITWDDVVTALEASLKVAISAPAAFLGAATAFVSAIGGVISGIVFGEEVDFDTVVSQISTGLSDAMTVDSFSAIGTKALEGITASVAALGDLSIPWPNALKFDFEVPELGEFPSWSDVFNIVWDGLKALGDLSIGWPNSFSLDFRVPSLGDFPSWNDIYNLAWNGLKALGDISIGWPNAFNVNFPNPGGGIPFVPGYADGGVTAGGLAMVGERGPELVRLPAGSFVHTASQTAAMLRGSGGGGDYYDLRGSIIGGDVMRAIDERIAAGSGKKITRGVSRGRLESSYS